MDRIRSPRGAGLVDSRALLVSAASLFLAAVISVLVQARLLAGLDLAVAQGKRVLVSGATDYLSYLASALASPRVSIAAAVVLCFLLWRLGLGWWALAPTAFLVPTLLETGLKQLIMQPMVPGEYHRPPTRSGPGPVQYGAFPSGHALRATFFGTFLAILLWRRGGLPSRILAVALILVALLIDFARVYGGQHWLSDVVAGMLLGVSAAVPFAFAVSDRLQARGS